ncbi:MAG: 4Fe-4S dicluster domain-containing protein [Dehalococcoidia bacterium]
MQMGFFFDQTLCVNCRACVVACKDWHNVPAGPASYIRISTVEKGRYPDVSVHSMFGSCYHCAEPACVAACPVGAITKRAEDGIVVVDRETCLGKGKCDLCRQVCPYDAPQFGAEPNARMQKCQFCLDRLAENKQPICVGACIMQALDAGPIEQLKAKYGDIIQAEGFSYSEKAVPSIVFNPKKDAKGRVVSRIVVSPQKSQ